MNELLMSFSKGECRIYLPLRKRGIEGDLSNKISPNPSFFKRGTETVVKSCVSIFLVIIGLTANDLIAEDSVSSLMQRMESETAVKIAYQETRMLELMEQPWQGSGYMYSMPPDLMIREQLQPQRLLMGVKADEMFYYDPVNDVRHQGEMDEGDALSLNLAVFKALINADEALLNSLYQVEFSTATQGWEMTLKNKHEIDSGFSIVVSGLPDQQADKISIKQADGDSSEFLLQKNNAGDAINTTVQHLYQELLGE